ncbi:hypothetical protein [Cupriavidus numazuensis]|uniref:Curlin associated repeat-containing protein n=1 Tax=Cupriavidus numazuensis TaxID=221992 RepID=A0ABM8TRE9_9BURK|nr:hypothetical protein [Cupriavidus numazuensis]CAG2158795.1 hypothetical protein LMG26411_06196 [Cupriavidus numazuensis]
MASVDQGGGYYNTAIISQQNGGVGGGYDHATIKQNAGSDHGNSNFASISQDTAGYLGYQTASIQQADLNASGMGHGNQASIAQYRNGSATGDIGQSGNFNYASIAQSFNIGANAGVYQHGTGNQAAFGGWDSINQFNTVSSLAYVQQNGDYNRGSIAQSNGSYLSANLMQQDGVSNLAYLSQGGGDHLTANVTQTGSWNVASTTQTGSYNDIVLTQDGFGNSANVLQSGIGGAGLAMNKVNISQTGNGMVSNVSQLSGSGNVTNIVQH